MKNKGFTLIELLAVIVILAIIALIATPIVLGIIEDTKQSANEVSAQYIIDAVEKAYTIAYTKNSGAVPSLEDVKAAFEMSGAEWKTTGEDNQVETTDGQVVCPITVDEDEFFIACTGFPNVATSETLELGTVEPEENTP